MRMKSNQIWPNDSASPAPTLNNGVSISSYPTRSTKPLGFGELRDLAAVDSDTWCSVSMAVKGEAGERQVRGWEGYWYDTKECSLLAQNGWPFKLINSFRWPTTDLDSFAKQHLDLTHHLNSC